MPPSDSEQNSGTAQTPYLCFKIDEYLTSLYPSHHAVPQETLKACLMAMGAEDTPESLLEYTEAINRRWDNLIESDRFQVVGEKPQPNDREVFYYPIPNSRLAIRVWDGGLLPYGHYFFDFFHMADRVPVATPAGHTLTAMHRRGAAPGLYGSLMTWDKAFDKNSPPSKNDKYSSIEGSQIVLERPGEPPFYFELPVRAAQQPIVFAKPVSTLPDVN